jgi:hypothetical protein
MFKFLVRKYLGVKLLGLVVSVCLTSEVLNFWWTFFWVVLAYELRASHLLGSTTWATLLSQKYYIILWPLSTFFYISCPYLYLPYLNWIPSFIIWHTTQLLVPWPSCQAHLIKIPFPGLTIPLFPMPIVVLICVPWEKSFTVWVGATRIDGL